MIAKQDHEIMFKEIDFKSFKSMACLMILLFLLISLLLLDILVLKMQQSDEHTLAGSCKWWFAGSQQEDTEWNQPTRLYSHLQNIFWKHWLNLKHFWNRKDNLLRLKKWEQKKKEEKKSLAQADNIKKDMICNVKKQMIYRSSDYLYDIMKKITYSRSGVSQAVFANTLGLKVGLISLQKGTTMLAEFYSIKSPAGKILNITIAMNH